MGLHLKPSPQQNKSHCWPPKAPWAWRVTLSTPPCSSDLDSLNSGPRSGTESPEASLKKGPKPKPPRRSLSGPVDPQVACLTPDTCPFKMKPNRVFQPVHLPITRFVFVCLPQLPTPCNGFSASPAIRARDVSAPDVVGCGSILAASFCHTPTLPPVQNSRSVVRLAALGMSRANHPKQTSCQPSFGGLRPSRKRIPPKNPSGGRLVTPKGGAPWVSPYPPNTGALKKDRPVCRASKNQLVTF